MRSPVLPLSKVKNAVVLPLLMAAVSCSTVKTPPADGPENHVPLYAINAGGGDYLAKDGIQYAADHFVKGGSFGSSGDPITGTADQVLYQHERWGRFSYAFPVKHGSYSIKLQMAETWFGPEQAGNRAFDVMIEGEKRLVSVDPLKAAGHDSAYSVTVDNIRVDDGELSIDFLPVKDSASVRSIAVYGEEGSRLETLVVKAQPTTIAPLTARCSKATGEISNAEDLVLFDGSLPPNEVVINTLELRHAWYLDETWATSSGALVEVEQIEDAIALTYRNAKGFSGFKLTPPVMHGARQAFKLTGVDIYVESERSGPEFGIRVIKPGEPENHGHASTATWLQDVKGKQELNLMPGCSLLSLQLPETWTSDDVANRFILEVREGWDKTHRMKIHRIVVKGYTAAP